MKKIITIGRGDGADICIEDDLVSRRHATIKFLPFGKMEIRDLSKNGTYVNGIRLAVNKPYPVTRKDVVSFARVRQLDWSEVPDPMRPYRIGAWIALAIIACIVVFSVVSSIDWGGEKKIQEIEQYEEPSPSAADKAKEKDKPESETGKPDKAAVKDTTKRVPLHFPQMKSDKKTDTKSDSKDKENQEEKKSSKSSDKKSEEPQKEEKAPTHWL